MQTSKREIGDERIPTIRDSFNLRFAQKLYLDPIVIWFLLVSLAMLATGHDDSHKENAHALLIGVAGIGLIWVGWTIQFHSAVFDVWREWLAQHSAKPLGRLPIFLHCPQNEPQYAWEELDEWDFNDQISAYLLDSEKLLNIVIGFFLIVLLAIVSATLAW